MVTTTSAIGECILKILNVSNGCRNDAAPICSSECLFTRIHDVERKSIDAHEAEEKAVTFVVKLGGSIIRDATKPVIEVSLATKDAVKDADLKEESLTKLVLSETKVTAAGVKELQAALPKCKIYHK